MLNAPIVAIANKTLGFSENALNVHQKFNKVKDASVNEIRSTLLPDASDRWIFILYSMLRSNHLAALEVGRHTMTFDPTINDYVQASLSAGSESVDLLRSGEGFACVASITDPGYPVDNAITLTNVGDKVVISTQGGSTASNYTQTSVQDLFEFSPERTGDSAEGTVLNWDSVPVTGIVSPPVTEQRDVTILTPFIYPAIDVAQSLSVVPGLDDTLIRYNLIDAFHKADGDTEKVSIALLLLWRAFKETNKELL